MTLQVWEGESIACPTEESVFEALGLEYKSPTQRNCYDVQFDLEDEESEKRGSRVDQCAAGGGQADMSKTRLRYSSSGEDEEGDGITNLLKRRKIKLP